MNTAILSLCTIAICLGLYGLNIQLGRIADALEQQ